MNLGIIGTGTIAAAIVTGLRSGPSGPASIILSPRNAKTAADLAGSFRSVQIAGSNQDVIDRCDVVILAVRPQVADEALSKLKFGERHLVLSILATFSIEKIASLVAPATRIVRAVPLPSVAFGEGPTAIYPSDPVIVDLFNQVGIAIPVDTPAQLDALATATAVMSSYFAFLQAVVSWLTRQGIRQSAAHEYVSRMIRGLNAGMAETPSKSLEALAGEHQTRGGINEQVLTSLNKHGVFENLSHSLDGAYRRVFGQPVQEGNQL
jgi:pyrroline-5-carboxylate reductase